MSSSSNELEYDHVEYDNAWPNETQSPWYPTYGQPLIYYSQVQPFRRWHKIRDPEKDKPNCFKKAFRWYTQEHVPHKNEHTDSSSNMNNAHLKGFAAWLDEKYNEFLQRSNIERNKHILTQISTVQIDKNTKFPWQKRKKYLNAKEKGDLVMKSNHSIEIILKPKEVSRPASECCVRSKAQSCCNGSITNVKSNATTMHEATRPKSQSFTSIVKEKEIYVIPCDIPEYGIKNAERRYENTPKIPKKESRWKSRRHRPKHVSCQCSRYMSEKTDASKQFEDKERKQQEPCTCKVDKTEVKNLHENRNIDEKQQSIILDPKTNAPQSKATHEQIFQKDEISTAANRTEMEKDGALLFIPVNECVQTSDHSINLNRNLRPEYPLFMRIVRADK